VLMVAHNVTITMIKIVLIVVVIMINFVIYVRILILFCVLSVSLEQELLLMDFVPPVMISIVFLAPEMRLFVPNAMTLMV
jgi:hypothetical protein